MDYATRPSPLKEQIPPAITWAEATDQAGQLATRGASILAAIVLAVFLSLVFWVGLGVIP
jgi:hypothetical protein